MWKLWNISHTSEISHQTWNLSNVLHQWDSQNFQFQPRKTPTSRHFWRKIENWVCFTNLFSTIYQFCAFIYSNTNSHQLFCENSYLNLANLAIFVIHRVNSGQFYPIPKTFYTSATCDKFHVWTQLLGGLGIDLSNQLKSNLFLLKLMIIRMYFP